MCMNSWYLKHSCTVKWNEILYYAYCMITVRGNYVFLFFFYKISRKRMSQTVSDSNRFRGLHSVPAQICLQQWETCSLFSANSKKIFPRFSQNLRFLDVSYVEKNALILALHGTEWLVSCSFIEICLWSNFAKDSEIT